MSHHQPEPTREHLWLQRFVGEWTYEGECATGPDQPPAKMTGTETVRAVGDLWVIGEGTGKIPDGLDSTMVITLGYDPQTQRFRGTWIGSMMAYLWVYDGTLDETGNILTLESEGPDFSGEGTLALYRDTFEVKSDDHRILSASVRQADGTWVTFMTTHYRRKA